MVRDRASRVIASPRARRAMRQRGVEAASIQGSGPGGRIVEADVVRAASQRSAGEVGFGAGSCFCLRTTANVSTLVSLQGQVAEQVQKLAGTPLRLGDLVLRAMAMAVAGMPEANRIRQNGTIAQLDGANVGLSMEGAGGQTLAVLRQAEPLELIELVRRRAELTAAAQSGKLPADAAQDAALALWDLSDQPVDECVPVVAPPLSSVLAIGRLAPRPVVIEEELSLRPTVVLNLAADSRVLSPETAARLLGRIVDLLERPFVLICDRPPW
jgi:pyruvate dehydrogenase E2 component (dihydrolipoamide acetyltransferase)